MPATATPVVVLLSDSGPLYQRFAQSFIKAFSNTPAAPEVQINFLPVTDFAPDTRLVVAVGARAARALSSTAEQPARLLALVTRNMAERLRAQPSIKGAVLVDPPDVRYAALARLALPSDKTLWLLASPDSQAATRRLALRLQASGVLVRFEPVDDVSDLPRVLNRLHAARGALLATPDARLFNSHTIPGMLLGAFRNDIPVIGFSPAYLEAGAALVLYSSPEQIAHQSARQAHAVLAGTPPGLQHAPEFTVVRNEYALRTLELRLPASADLYTRLSQLEEAP